jgi:hypothetical protein
MLKKKHYYQVRSVSFLIIQILDALVPVQSPRAEITINIFSNNLQNPFFLRELKRVQYNKHIYNS